MNLPDIVDYSLKNGYTVAWGADVSEKGFSWKNGLAIVPADEFADLKGPEKAKWDELSRRKKMPLSMIFPKPIRKR